MQNALTPFHVIDWRNLTLKVSHEITTEKYLILLKGIVISKNWLVTFGRDFVKLIWTNEWRQNIIYRKNNSKKYIALCVGDILLVKDETHISRGHWRLGKVDELVVGRDGRTRAVS